MHFNLADRANTDFRAKVLTGGVQPATLLRMAPQDMASEARAPLNPKNPDHPLRCPADSCEAPAAAGHSLRGARPCNPKTLTWGPPLRCLLTHVLIYASRGGGAMRCLLR